MANKAHLIFNSFLFFHDEIESIIESIGRCYRYKCAVYNSISGFLKLRRLRFFLYDKCKNKLSIFSFCCVELSMLKSYFFRTHKREKNSEKREQGADTDS